VRVSAISKDTAFGCPMDALARPARGLPLEATESCVSLCTLRHARRQPNERITIVVEWSQQTADLLRSEGKAQT